MNGTPRHRLLPLFEPTSIAVVGASPREGSVGHAMTHSLLAGKFNGSIHMINPRHAEIAGHTCLPCLHDLENTPDMAILNVGANRMEAALEEAINCGVRSAVMFDACQGENERGEKILPRIRDMIREAGLPVCGGNGMGYFDVPGGCHVSFYPGDHLKAGGITLIAHSGSVFTVLALNDPRYRFDLVVSPGQEIGATIDEYMDYALDRPGTKVIALFMEEARNPQGFCNALSKAADQNIPVVVCKVGRTEESARLAQTHSGAMAGSAAAYEAAIEQFGAIGVSTVDQLMNVSMLMAQGRTLGPGEPAFVTDSGGLREALIDRAFETGVTLATLSDKTAAALSAELPEPLVPSNPQDCAGALSDNFEVVFESALNILAEADEVNMIGLEIDARDDYVYSDRLVELAQGLPAMTDKPCFVYSSFSQTNNREFGAALADINVPLINGADEMLSAVTHVSAWHDAARCRHGKAVLPAEPPANVVTQWQDRLVTNDWISETEGLALISDFGIPIVSSVSVNDRSLLKGAADNLGFPLVLKTGERNIAHKSDVGGVVLGIKNDEELKMAYDNMCRELGPTVIIQPMSTKGVELSFGCVVDPNFGPLVMVSAGGTLIEILNDRRIALAPFNLEEALRLINGLRMTPLLDGARGAEAVDKKALADALSRFSVMCSKLKNCVGEVDINPIIATSDGILAVDALVIPSGTEH